MRKLLLLPLLTFLPGLALAQSVRDVQIAPSTNSLFGASLNVTGNSEVSLYNTSSLGSNLDSFRFWQGIYSGSNQLLLDLTPNGAVFGTATGGSKGAGTINAQGLFINGTAFSPASLAGGTNGQVQFNNAGALGGFTVGGDGTLNTGTGNLVVTKTNGTSFSALATTTPGTGVATALGTNVGTAGAFVVNGGALGTPTSGVGTNLTALSGGNITAGSVPNTALTSSSITIAGQATALGGTYAPARAGVTVNGSPGVGTGGGPNMAGFNVTFTPTTTGNMLFIGSINASNNSASNGGCIFTLAFGTGTAPVHNAGPSGTTFGMTAGFGGFGAGAQGVTSSLPGIRSGFTLGTTYWIDVQYSINGSGTCTINTYSLIAIEL